MLSDKQKQFDSSIKDRLSRQQQKFEAELQGLGVEGGLQGLRDSYQRQQEEALDAAKAKGQYKSLYEAEKTRASELQAQIQSIKEEQRRSAVRNSLTELASDAVSPLQVAQLVQAELGSRGLNINVSEAGSVVTDATGAPITDGKGGLMTAASVVTDFLNRNPHFRKPTATPGGGAGSRPGQAPAPVPRKAGDNLFGDLSDTDNVAKNKEAIKAAMRDGTLY